MEHKYNSDRDRCDCGGVIVYFDEWPGAIPSARGVGDGCEVFGEPFNPTFLVGTKVTLENEMDGVIESSYELNGQRWYFVNTGEDDGSWEVTADEFMVTIS